MSCVNRATAHDNGKLPFSPAMWLCPEINFHQIEINTFADRWVRCQCLPVCSRAGELLATLLGRLRGLDSRGIAITGHYNLTTVNVTNMPCNIFVETTSVLRVGKGLQIEVLA